MSGLFGKETISYPLTLYLNMQRCCQHLMRTQFCVRISEAPVPGESKKYHHMTLWSPEYTKEMAKSSKGAFPGHATPDMNVTYHSYGWNSMSYPWDRSALTCNQTGLLVGKLQTILRWVDNIDSNEMNLDSPWQNQSFPRMDARKHDLFFYSFENASFNNLYTFVL